VADQKQSTMPNAISPPRTLADRKRSLTPVPVVASPPQVVVSLPQVVVSPPQVAVERKRGRAKPQETPGTAARMLRPRGKQQQQQQLLNNQSPLKLADTSLPPASKRIRKKATIPAIPQKTVNHQDDGSKDATARAPPIVACMKSKRYKKAKCTCTICMRYI